MTGRTTCAGVALAMPLLVAVLGGCDAKLTDNNPIPQVEFGASIVLDVFENRDELTFADLDGDGDLDGVAEDCVGFENIGNAQSPVWVRNDLILGNMGAVGGCNFYFTTGAAGFFTFGDLDGDGDLDWLSSDGSGYRNIGTPNSPMFEADENLIQGLSDGSGFHLTDIDGDGDLDILHKDLSYAWQNVGSVLSPIWSKSPALTNWADALIDIVGTYVYGGMCVRPLVPAVGQQVVLAGRGKVCIAMLQSAATSGGPVDLVDYRCLDLEPTNPDSIHCLDFSGDGLPDLGVYDDDDFTVYFQTPETP